MTWLRFFRRKPKHVHEFVNTGAFYTDREHGFTVVLTQCVVCKVALIVEV